MKATRAKAADVVIHPTGTIIFPREREPDNPEHIKIICRCCGQPKYVHEMSIRYKGWQGFCSECFSKNGIVSKRLKGKHTLRSGRIVDYDDRDESRTHCSVKCPECNRVDYILVEAVDEDAGCRSCARIKHPRLDETLEWRSMILWSQATHKTVPVVCGYCLHALGLSIEQSTRDVQKKVITNRRARRLEYTGYHQEHHNEAMRWFYMSAVSAQQNAPSVHSNPVSQPKRPRGRRVGDILLDYDEFISNVKTCVVEEWQEMGRSVTAVKQASVLARYHHKCPGDRIATSTLKARLMSAGYRTKWPVFVETTVQECASS